MACVSQKYVGRSVVMEYAIGCGDELPSESDWQRFGAMRTKDFTLEWETTDGTADDSIGALRENLATFQNLSVSGDGTAKASGIGSAALIALTKHVANPVATNGQPLAWIRMTFPDLTFTAFMIVTNVSRSAPYDDVTTYTFEASATASDFGLIVEDTPDPDADPVTGVTVTPDTLEIEVNGTSQATVVVAPPAAPQNVQWMSSDVGVATVTQNGLVTGMAPGAATITVRSGVDTGISDTIAVTVTDGN